MARHLIKKSLNILSTVDPPEHSTTVEGSNETRSSLIEFDTTSSFSKSSKYQNIQATYSPPYTPLTCNIDKLPNDKKNWMSFDRYGTPMVKKEFPEMFNKEDLLQNSISP